MASQSRLLARKIVQPKRDASYRGIDGDAMLVILLCELNHILDMLESKSCSL